MDLRKSARKRLRGAGAMLIGLLIAGQASAQSAPAPPSAPPPTGYRPQSVANGVQVETPYFQDTLAVLDNLPASAPARPKTPRKVLVFCRAVGYAHSVIPLTAFTIKALGDRTGAWSTTITYRLGDFSAERLANYDVLVLDNTTGTFLDDADAAATAVRRAALLSYVRSGHGLVLTHAAGDAYHTGLDSPGRTQKPLAGNTAG